MPIIGIQGDTTGLPVSVAELADEKADTVAGGGFTAGAWQTRTLNTERYDPDGIVTLSGNQFTLQPGEYRIEWRCPAYLVNLHQTRLYNVTSATVERYGSSEYAGATAAMTNQSGGSYVVNPAVATAYRIEHYCGTTQNVNGFGIPCSFGVGEVYSLVTITKIG